ncbi:hypothetical protein AB205_0210210 [Aquarana catesbeiana]|uniref:Uncharacterized protein n=1 Tax=Aquarana catesbeiana TaxID=8400 RepID=A0A2G9SM21_AQUCT|nr:hypothetical protein AB205_0210210 [Aquarana catesbeiana]
MFKSSSILLSFIKENVIKQELIRLWHRHSDTTEKRKNSAAFLYKNLQCYSPCMYLFPYRPEVINRT